MRLTKVLYRQNYYRTFQRVWRKQGKMEINELSIPPELQEVDTNVHDARELFMAPRSYTVAKEEDPVIPIPSYNTTEEKYYLFHHKTRLTEGLDQILALTKTVSYEGLPPNLSKLIGQVQIANQDQLVQECIKQSLLWDGYQKRLPKKLDIQKPGWIFPRDYGVPLKRKMSLFLSRLVLLCEGAVARYPESLSRTKMLDNNSELHIVSGKADVSFQLKSEILICDEKPLQPFASADEVLETKLNELPSIYPIKPTLDLDQCESCPISEDSEQVPHTPSKSYIHTLHIPHKSIGFFFPFQKLCRGIAGCFSFAAEEARRLHGPNVKELLDPISVQCVYMDIKSFGFIAYQLNTLDLSSEEGIKNQVWIDGPYDLYEELNDENGVVNYNPEVFPKMLALHLNGMHPSSLV